MPYMKRLAVYRTGVEAFLGMSVIVGTMVVSAIGLQRLENSSKWVRHTYDTRLLIEDIQLTVRTYESEQRGYLLTKKKLYLKSDYNKAMQRLDKAFQALLESVNDNSYQRKRVEDCYFSVERRLKILAEVVTLTQQGKIQQAKIIIDSGKGNITQELVTQQLTAIKVEEERLLSVRLNQQSEAYKSLITYIFFGEVISLVVVAASTYAAIKIAIKQQSYIQFKIK